MTTVHIAAGSAKVAWKMPDSGSHFPVQRIPSPTPTLAQAPAPRPQSDEARRAASSSNGAPHRPPAGDAAPPALQSPSSSSPSSSSSVAICNLHDYQRLARLRLPRPLYEYLASGTDDEQTLSQNVCAFKQWFLRPRVLRPVGTVSTETTLFGRTLSAPVFVSPAGVQALCDPTGEGERATARACARVGTAFGLSQHATRTIEDVAEAVRSAPAPPPGGGGAAANLWYQCYILRDRGLTLRLVRRAVDAGYSGIFLTVDSARFGYREADARNGWDALPEPHRLVNYDEEKAAADETYNARDHAAWDQNSERMFDADATWEDVAWLKREGCPNLPLVVKGIMTAEDALLALDAGADGVMVSNHGGRGLDGALASVDALPEIVRAVRGAGSAAPVLLDGGIRRGSDVVKALTNMLRMLQRETEACMAICGVSSVGEITRRLVTRHPSGGPAVSYLRAKL